MGSLDDLFIRIEGQADNYEDILNWLSDDGKKNKESFTNTAAILAEPYEIEKRIEVAKLESFDELQKDINSVSISKARIRLNSQLSLRKKEIQSKIEKESKNIEREFKSKIKQAETPEEVSQILDQTDSPTIPQKTRNKIKDEADRKLKEIRKAKAEELREQQQAARIERLKREKEEREAEAIRKEEERQAKAAEANRIREERQAEIAREKERQREEELREALRQERKIAEEIARQQLRENE